MKIYKLFLLINSVTSSKTAENLTLDQLEQKILNIYKENLPIKDSMENLDTLFKSNKFDETKYSILKDIKNKEEEKNILNILTKHSPLVIIGLMIIQLILSVINIIYKPPSDKQPFYNQPQSTVNAW
jgi:hypothetical protein